MRGLVLAGASAFLLGCLSEPPEPEWQGAAFPPAGATVDLRSGYVTDFDYDGFDDIVLLNATGDPNTQGFFVLLGRDTSDGTLYDSFIATPDVQPYAALAADLGGGDDPDVIIYGESDGRGQLVAYTDASPATFEAPLVLTLGNSQPAPAGGSQPAFISLGDYDTVDGENEIVFGHANGVFISSIDQWDDEFRLNEVYSLSEPGLAWGDTDAVGAILEGTPPTQDILVPQQEQVTWYANGGDGSFTSDIHNTAITAPGMTHVDYADINGDGRKDVFAVGSFAVSVYVPAAGATDGARYLLYDDGTTGENDDGELDGIAAVQVDEDSRPDIVIMERANSSMSDNFIKLYANVSIDNGMMVADEEVLQDLGSFEPQLMVFGDFDGDEVGELIVFDARGNSQCYELKVTAILPC